MKQNNKMYIIIFLLLTVICVATIVLGGVDAPRTIEGNAKLQEAYEMGKNV